MTEKKFLGYVIACGMMRVWCYNQDSQEWKQNPEIATLYKTVIEAENAIKNLQKYRDTAAIRTLKVNDAYLSVGSISWMDLDKRRKDELT